jgi:phage gpG-like protein
MSNDVPDFKKIGAKLIADVPRYASVTALNFFKDSFRKQGWEDVSFEPWKGRKNASDSGRAILTNTSYLQNELRRSSATSKSIRIVNDAPYAAIHNEGGRITIRITPKMRKYFWYMYYKTKQDKYKAMALTKKTAFLMNIPQRQFMGHSKVMMNQMDVWFLKQIQTRFKQA